MAIYYARANGNVNATNVWATTPTGTAGDFFPSFTSADTLVSNGFNITVNVNTTVLEVRGDNTGGATPTGSFTINAGITLTSNAYAGQQNTGGVVVTGVAGTSIATLIGNVFGGSGTQSFGVVHGGAGTLIINGNISGGTGNICHGARNNGGGKLIVIGNVSASTSAFGILNEITSSVEITGNVTGGGNASNGVGISNNTGTITVIGTVTGGTVGVGISHGGVGSVNIIGVAIGGTGAVGANNSGGGTLTVTRAKGNGFGNGSVGLTSQVGVSAGQNGLTRVYEIEYGDLGQSPTSGPVFLFPASSNVALFYRSGTTKKTLVDATSSSGLLPNSSDVRSGVTYNAGTNIGTMAVPAAASVALGVSVDNTVGTAILTSGNIGDIWNYPVSGISVSNSIGERLKNCSTVSSMGTQLAAALSNVQ